LVTDANMCPESDTFSIIQPPALVLSLDTSLADTCGRSSGMAMVNTIGGASPYSYSWNTFPVQTNDTATGLAAGTYTVTVTDANGCMDSISVDVDSVPGPAIDNLFILEQIICNGDSNGVVTVTVKEGAPPYTYNWSPIAGANDTVYGLYGAQWYTVTVTDDNGCFTEDSILVPEPAALSAPIVTFTNESCTFACNGNATVSVLGGIPSYTYQWKDSLGIIIPGETNSMITGLCAGTYSVTVTDSVGCVTNSSISISSSVFSSGTVITNVSCSGLCDGSVIISPIGSAGPYLYLFDRDTLVISITNAVVNGLCPDTFEYSIIDTILGCFTEDSIIITEPELLQIDSTWSDSVSCKGNDGTAAVRVSRGTPPYDFSWSNGGIDSIITGLSTGLYEVTITDLNGCPIVDTVIVDSSVIVCECNPLPFQGFSPNGDEINDLWIIDGIEFCKKIEVTIFNRWGDVVWENNDDLYTNESADVEEKHVWDGTYYRNGYPVADGTYFYLIKVPGVRPKHGWVYIVR